MLVYKSKQIKLQKLKFIHQQAYLKRILRDCEFLKSSTITNSVDCNSTL